MNYFVETMISELFIYFTEHVSNNIEFQCKCATLESHFDDFTGRTIATTSEIINGEIASTMNRTKCESF